MKAPSSPFTRAIYFVALLTVSSFLITIQTFPVRATRSQNEAGRATPRQREISRQQQRLSSADPEERRDALMKLTVLRHPDASRVALPALQDPEPIVRAAAAKAILSLQASQVVDALVPLLADRDEFVRQEVAYALGRTHSSAAVRPLGEVLLTDKKDGVRAGAAVALGEIADSSALPVLIQAVTGQPVGVEGKKKRKPKPEKNEFVVRAAIAALGRIGDRAAVPTLVATLDGDKIPGDVKREAARSLGLIADPAAVPALQNALSSSDPYLSLAASEALKRISRAR